MIIIGTSGYYFPDWAGTFYPSDLKKQDWLTFYAHEFPIVEINSTYYRLPAPETVAKWNMQTPGNFGFVVKVHSDTTHKRKDGAKEVREVLDLFNPLIHNGKFRGLLAQFPVSFHRSTDSEKYLILLAERCENVDLFIELRHKSWDSVDGVSFLRDLNLNWVAVDQPALPSLTRPRPATTGKIAYVRFHGRNAKTWYNPDQGDRYDWEYSDAELETWIPRIRALDSRAETTYLFFNNCHAGQAIKSALRMREMLKNQFEIL
ncbi:DUF72 domain-containing protein [bacterium]|nr:DUF72 domain-containing protein [bacterium]